MIPPPPKSTLFPYTTLFRSVKIFAVVGDLANGRISRGRDFHQVDRKSTRLNSSHLGISYAVFCLKKKNFAAVDIFVTLFRDVVHAAKLATSERSGVLVGA